MANPFGHLLELRAVERRIDLRIQCRDNGRIIRAGDGQSAVGRTIVLSGGQIAGLAQRGQQAGDFLLNLLILVDRQRAMKRIAILHLVDVAGPARTLNHSGDEADQRIVLELDGIVAGVEGGMGHDKIADVVDRGVCRQLIGGSGHNGAMIDRPRQANVA